jgi:hypothetical protein
MEFRPVKCRKIDGAKAVPDNLGECSYSALIAYAKKLIFADDRNWK